MTLLASSTQASTAILARHRSSMRATKIDETALAALIRAAVALNTSARAPVRPSVLKRNQGWTNDQCCEFKRFPSLWNVRCLIRRKRSGARSLQPHLIEEWLMKNDFKPVVDHRFDLRADWGAVDCQVMAVEPNKTLSYTWAAYTPREHRHFDSHRYELGDPPAYGAVGLPAGSAAGLPGRQGRVAAVLCVPGAGRGADRLKSTGRRAAGSWTSGDMIEVSAGRPPWKGANPD